MHHDALIGRVQAGAGLPDRGSAERAVRATLETLAERLPDGVADHLAAQLPREVGEHLRRVTASHERTREQRGRGDRFDLTTFLGRVAWRAGCPEDEALREATAVLEVVDAAVAPELMDRLGRVLPADIRELLPISRAQGA
ncbi:DUF2267 domain-containing protein [Streptomyces capparidis]